MGMFGALALGGLLASCVDQPDYAKHPYDAYANFDVLAETVGSRYCFFKEKDVDWDALCAEYRKQITDSTSQIDLFFIMSDLLDNLRMATSTLSLLSTPAITKNGGRTIRRTSTCVPSMNIIFISVA